MARKVVSPAQPASIAQLFALLKYLASLSLIISHVRQWYNSHQMHSNFLMVYKTLLLAGDTFSLISGFVLAYILRVKLDARPLIAAVPAKDYLKVVLLLLPLWILVFVLFGLYSKRVYESRPAELIRLLVGSSIGILLFIAYDFVMKNDIFPARLVPVYAAALSFVLLVVVRYILRYIRLALHKRGVGVERIVLVGSTVATQRLAEYLIDNRTSGYEVVGIVASKQFVPDVYRNRQYSSLSSALAVVPHVQVIVQTGLNADEEKNNQIVKSAQKHHIDYRFVPAHSALFTARHSVDLIGAVPIITVHNTPLVGYGRIVKRILDITISLVALIILSPLFALIALLIKLDDVRSSVFFRQKRVTRFNKIVRIYKFRTLKSEFSGKNDIEVFKKLGRQDLIDEFNANRGKVKDDPRITPIGKLLRASSLDELPQLLNVLGGSISLVGPRAITEAHADEYGEYKALMLMVKTGITGLAQVSGRDDLNLDERIRLDVYYVQNWSLWLDIAILLKTARVVVFKIGRRS